jgi:glutathione S-transferase
MTDYLDVVEARKREGAKLVLTRGIPGPWGESAKGVLHAKGIPFLRVAQEPGGANEDLVEWTQRDNAPVLMFGHEPPRSGWGEILELAERLAPEPALIPADPDARVLMFGLAHEICGEGGFGWSRRLMMIDAMLPNGENGLAGDDVGAVLGRRYGYSDDAVAAAPDRARSVLRMLKDRLATQHARGSRYFIGDSVTALDIYWAAFAALVEPLPDAECPMPDYMRPFYTASDEQMRSLAEPELLPHRDFIYREYMEFPVRL